MADFEGGVGCEYFVIGDRHDGSRDMTSDEWFYGLDGPVPVEAAIDVQAPIVGKAAEKPGIAKAPESVETLRAPVMMMVVVIVIVIVIM